MFEGSSEKVECGRPTWDAPLVQIDWRRVDRELQAIAKRRGALDASEAGWLREAERLRIWEHLGMVSALDYLERTLGYTPHAARERLRVANALAELPVIAESFAIGELPFSAVRELTRIATTATDAAWRDAAVGKSVREIEQAVAVRRRGIKPTDPPDPTVRNQVIRFELRPDTYARLRQARTAVADEHGRQLDDDDLITALCDAALERTAASSESSGRAKFQIAVTVCERCQQGWQQGGGAQLPIDAVAVEQAFCDAQHIGSLDGDQPVRAHQDISPATVRLVWHRDGGRCQTPGCRSSRGLEIHHVVHRSDGGSHDPSNLTLRCSACHRAHHEGKLTISGVAPDRLETRRHGARDIQPALLDEEVMRAQTRDAMDRLETRRNSSPGIEPLAEPADAILRAQTRDALVGMGWKPAIARDAVDAAASHVGRDVPIEAWIREALRHCSIRKTV